MECYKMTNYDRIKAMSVEEMEKLLSSANDEDLMAVICNSSYCDEFSEENYKCSGQCNKAIMKWLESEADGKQ